MEISDAKAPNHDKSECVRVAVNIRPLIEPELVVGCTDCITVVPGETQVLFSCLLSSFFQFTNIFSGFPVFGQDAVPC